MGIGLIYKVTNLVNGKCYIGQTINGLVKRKRQHLGYVRRGKRYTFHKAIRKYGEENFEWEVLEDNISCNMLDAKETEYIIEKDCLRPNGYNMILPNGHPVSEFTNEQRDLMKDQIFELFDTYERPYIDIILKYSVPDGRVKEWFLNLCKYDEENNNYIISMKSSGLSIKEVKYISNVVNKWNNSTYIGYYQFLLDNVETLADKIETKKSEKRFKELLRLELPSNKES